MYNIISLLLLDSIIFEVIICHHAFLAEGMCSKYFDARLGMQVATPQQRFCQHFFPQSMLSKKLGFPFGEQQEEVSSDWLMVSQPQGCK